MNSVPPKHRFRTNLRAAAHRLRHASVTTLVLVALLALASPIALDDGDPARAQAPTVPGAPFLPIMERTNHVIERYEAHVAIDALDSARQTLSLQIVASADADDVELGETALILDAQREQLERTLAELEDQSADLLEETAPFGLGLAVFPVDEVRKPFWDDWGRPRSGGRAHVGTDVLAQIGVPLRAIEDGIVEALPGGGNGGKGIFMIGDSGSRWYYAHMDEHADLEVGDRVLAGQPVGTVGDSGNATGAPHLHMQWDPTGGSDWQNPFPLLDVLYGQGRTQAAAVASSNALNAETQDLRDADGTADGDTDDNPLASIAVLHKSSDEREPTVDELADPSRSLADVGG